ncbi:Phage-related holin (Lysis protein) [Paenibacillus sp. UNC496MF]|uniref:phage holin family protein n=1 Tax=Paenibacillus sp. UNC496MF TaxID=1502753 RepID=UPI0008E59063|nr:phage holin family protein [Paenibacillus sp. UNC496MF]SFJ65668.1 Phage-related holin (Lysis protein) [Paenibacillus sp. UNC496MF]
MQRFITNKPFDVESIVTPVKLVIAALGALIGSGAEVIYGSGEDRMSLIGIYAFFIFMDWISGVAASKKDGSYASEYGINGILRTIFILCFPAAANMLDFVFHTPGVFFYGVTSGLIFHTWNSLTANSVRAGWEKWIPKAIIKSVQSEINAKQKRATSSRTRSKKESGDDEQEA